MDLPTNVPDTVQSKNKLKKDKYGSSYTLIFPFLCLYFVFIFIPMLGIIIKSFTTDNSMHLEILEPSRLFTSTFSIENYVYLFSNSYFKSVLSTTLIISIISVLITIIIGTPIAYQLTKKDFKLIPVLKWIITLPIYLPIIVIAYALVLFFGPHGVLNQLFESIFQTRLTLVFTIPAVIAGTVFVLLPMYVRVVTTSFESIPKELIEASYNLGGSELYTLIRVILPMSIPSILAAVILNFSFAIGLIEIALIVGGGGLNVPYLPVEILHKAISFNFDISIASAMGTVLLVISLLAQFISMMLLRRYNL